MYRTLYGMPDTATPETRTGRRPALTRERVAGEALRLLDRDGLGALSMRRLAAELGVGTMTLYGYVRDKDELLDAVVDAASAPAETIELEGDWRTRLETLMRALHGALAARPWLVQLRFTRPLLSPGALRLTETAMRVLLDAGFSADEAARAYRALFLHTFACAGFEGATGDLRGVAATLAMLPADEYPALSGAAVEAVRAMEPDAQFESGLALILDGVSSGR
jgi:AcrR family transcriptional regulator